MKRKIIQINQEKCNGCGLCVNACHEGAIGLVEGKAALLRDDYCDGLGDCLPACPTGAISFEEREAAAYNPEAVRAAKETTERLPCGCPGTQSKVIERSVCAVPSAAVQASQLQQWPVQIKLAPAAAPYFDNAHLLIAADCTAYAYGNFHTDFMKNKITLIGCPKLDPGDYSEKLADILMQNTIQSVTVVRMEVPCCGGIESAVKTALRKSGKLIPWGVHVISTDGRLMEL